MNKRKLWFYGSLIVLLVCLFLLITGSSLLTISLNRSNTMPLGTLITWVGFISFPLTLYWGINALRNPMNRRYLYLSNLLKSVLALAILWVPFCYLLAGNISFTFTEKEAFQGGQSAMKLFWFYSYGIPILTVALLISHWILQIFVNKK